MGVCLLWAAFAGGCSWVQSTWGSDERVVQDVPLSGAPPLRLVTAGGKHVVVLEAPTPGWSLSYDAFERTSGPTRIFASLHRGDPTLLVPQVVVEKQAITAVDADEAVELFARVLDHDEEESGRAYRRVPTGPAGDG